MILHELASTSKKQRENKYIFKFLIKYMIYLTLTKQILLDGLKKPYIYKILYKLYIVYVYL